MPLFAKNIGGANKAPTIRLVIPSAKKGNKESTNSLSDNKGDE